MRVLSTICAHFLPFPVSHWRVSSLSTALVHVSKFRYKYVFEYNVRVDPHSCGQKSFPSSAVEGIHGLLQYSTQGNLHGAVRTSIVYP